MSFNKKPVFCHLFVVVVVVVVLSTSMTRIAMLTGVFILLVGPPKSDRLKDRGQTKKQHSLFFSLYFPIFLPFTFLFYSSIFLLFLCFSRPYI